MLKFLCTMFGLWMISANLQAADLVHVKWDKGKGGHVVAAFDLVARTLRWEINPCKTANFAAGTSVGVLIGCDDSSVILLDATSGKDIWRRDIAMTEPDERKRGNRPFREIKINRFHFETPQGLFVSFADEIYVLIGKNGEYLMRCDAAGGCISNPRADREEQTKKPLP